MLNKHSSFYRILVIIVAFALLGIIDLILVVRKAGEVSDRLSVILLLDLLADRDGLVVVRRSAGTESNGDIIRMKIAQHLECFVDVGKLRLRLRREDLE